MCKANLIIDFDSTFAQVESLEELAEIVLQDRSDKSEVINEIIRITNQAMNCEISFTDALTQRIQLLQAHECHLALLVEKLQTKITPSFEANKSYFQEHGKNIYIFTWGFKEFVWPIVKSFWIPEENIYANRFLFDETWRIVWFDRDCLMSHKWWKVKQLERIKLDGPVWVVGDWYTDYEMKEAWLAEKFFAFIWNVRREKVVNKADSTLTTFDQLLALL